MIRPVSPMGIHRLRSGNVSHRNRHWHMYRRLGGRGFVGTLRGVDRAIAASRGLRHRTRVLDRTRYVSSEEDKMEKAVSIRERLWLHRLEQRPTRISGYRRPAIVLAFHVHTSRLVLQSFT